MDGFKLKRIIGYYAVQELDDPLAEDPRYVIMRVFEEQSTGNKSRIKTKFMQTNVHNFLIDAEKKARKRTCYVR